ncbi:MAG: sugar ABC transporter substrate-binding protein, partial [Treponema sp.]|nr:sugar ABC transporter substrate-binding protein [Treponema sp.]
MKNRVFLAMLLIFTLVFCGSLFAIGTGQQTAPAGTTTLTWSLWDQDLTVYYQPLIDAYVARNPNIRIA